MSNGDGILLDGRTLYVVQNQLNQSPRSSSRAHLDTGRVLELITDPLLRRPDDDRGARQFLFAVNARFTTPPTPDTPYWITRFEK